jgi:mannose-6-phosphate isomerase-like protein (cupin superfamily)
MADTKPTRGVKIYRAADAVDLASTDFMTYSESSEAIPQEILERIGSGALAGSVLKVLVRDAGGFSLIHVWFKANYPLPRHSHDADCIYYVISGSAVMGNQTLRPGDSFLVPSGAPYQYNAGPEGVEVLEIRHGTRQFDINVFGAGPARWEALAETIEENQAGWRTDSTSPTFAANAG